MKTKLPLLLVLGCLCLAASFGPVAVIPSAYIAGLFPKTTAAAARAYLGVVGSSGPFTNAVDVGTFTINGGTQTTVATNSLSIAVTNNDAAVTHNVFGINLVSTASAAGSTIVNWSNNAASVFKVRKDGYLQLPDAGIATTSIGPLIEYSGGYINLSPNNDATLKMKLGNPITWATTVGIARKADRVLVVFDGITQSVYSDIFLRQLQTDYTVTAAGTTTPQTINKSSGSINFAAGDVTKLVTCSLASTTSQIFVTVQTDDATATIKNVVAAAGSFTIRLTAAATAETKVSFFIVNP